jgi:glycine betaine/proline transport system substrate-binding protein
MVEFPKWEEVCETDPAWGLSKEKTFDCGAPAPDIEKFVWPGLKDKFPAAYKFLKAFQFTNQDQGPLMKAVDVDGRPAPEVAKEWVDQNKAKWEPWVQAATM